MSACCIQPNLFLQQDFARVLNNPEDFVLKPQREGGGNNFYKGDIKNILDKMLKNETKTVKDSDDEDITNKNRYIVMELLKPRITDNILVSQGSQQILAKTKSPLKTSKINNELGTYGVLVK